MRGRGGAARRQRAGSGSRRPAAVGAASRSVRTCDVLVTRAVRIAMWTVLCRMPQPVPYCLLATKRIAVSPSLKSPVPAGLRISILHEGFYCFGVIEALGFPFQLFTRNLSCHAFELDVVNLCHYRYRRVSTRNRIRNWLCIDDFQVLRDFPRPPYLTGIMIELCEACVILCRILATYSFSSFCVMKQRSVLQKLLSLCP